MTLNLTNRKEIPMKHNTNAHPFFAINLSRNFEVDSDELRAFVMAMPDWKYIELEGVDTEGFEVDILFLWSSSNTANQLYDDQIYALAEFLDSAGFDVNPEDVLIVRDYDSFTCECCNFAPVVHLEDMSRVEGIYGNVDNYQLYIQLAMCNASLAKRKNK